MWDRWHSDDGAVPALGADHSRPHQLTSIRNSGPEEQGREEPASPPGRLQPPGTPVSISSPCSPHAPPVARGVQSLRGFGLVSVRRASDGVPRESDLEGWRAHARVWWHAGRFCLWFPGTPYSPGPKAVGTWVAFRVTVGPGGGLMIGRPWGWPRAEMGEHQGQPLGTPAAQLFPASGSRGQHASVEAQLYSGPLVHRLDLPQVDSLLQELKVGPPASGTPRGPGRPQLCKQSVSTRKAYGVWTPNCFSLSVLSSASPTFFLDRRSKKRTFSPIP